jgi:hypothetical protein
MNKKNNETSGQISTVPGKKNQKCSGNKFKRHSRNSGKSLSGTLSFFAATVRSDELNERLVDTIDAKQERRLLRKIKEKCFKGHCVVVTLISNEVESEYYVDFYFVLKFRYGPRGADFAAEVSRLAIDVFGPLNWQAFDATSDDGKFYLTEETFD